MILNRKYWNITKFLITILTKLEKKLNSDKKSLSYSLTYRNKDRTLKSKEVDNEHQKVLNELKSKLDVSFR